MSPLNPAFAADFWIDRLESDRIGLGLAPRNPPPGFEGVDIVDESVWVVWSSTWEAVIDLVRAVAAEHDVEWCDSDCAIARAVAVLREKAP